MPPGFRTGGGERCVFCPGGTRKWPESRFRPSARKCPDGFVRERGALFKTLPAALCYAKVCVFFGNLRQSFPRFLAYLAIDF